MEKKKNTNNAKSTKKVQKKSVKKTSTKRKSTGRKGKGFTLIELLAVIIILGVLMLIAIPAVTSYISSSRKSSYISSAKNIIGGARNLVNRGDLGMFDTDVTYYIPVKRIPTENGTRSPYGDFTEAYVGVVYTGKGYEYYWISNDTSKEGIPIVTALNKLDNNLIQSDVKDIDIRSTVETTGIGGRSKILILSDNDNWEPERLAIETINDNGDKTLVSAICKPATSLHTEICNKTQYGCKLITNTGNTVTYGTIVNGARKSGDAYDCDVNADGVYDSETERFYYVTSVGDESVFIYYRNVGGESATYSYDSNYKNNYGPRSGYSALPSISEWKNPGIVKPGVRQIVGERGQTSTQNGEIVQFDYLDKAARLITVQEINTACNVTLGGYVTNELRGCLWLFENIPEFIDSNVYQTFGYWLENPHVSSKARVWNLDGSDISVGNAMAGAIDFTGIRPVITVKTVNVE